jgi:uncharacterized membrane protein (UPF0127 family)
MRFPIDVMFVDKAGKVRKIVRSMPAWRLAAAWGARDTIELAAGVLDSYDVRVGDTINVRQAA